LKMKMTVGYRKIKISIFALFLTGILFLTGCGSQNKSELAIPEGYTVNESLYLAEGAKLYAFIESDSMDYDTIRSEICNGDAESVKERYGNMKAPEDDPERYAAVQNVLGITEVYLGEYEQAYESFNKAADVVNDSQIPEKGQILAVLYNNAGAVTTSLPEFDTVDTQLDKAAGLCEDPYMALIVELNQAIRIRAMSSIKEYGLMIGHLKKIIRRERRIKGNPGLIEYQAALYMAIGYVQCGKEEKGAKLLDQYIALIPDTPEYNMQRAFLSGYRGSLYCAEGEYGKAAEKLEYSIMEAKKTADERSRRLSEIYVRYAEVYGETEDWKNQIACAEKAIRGAGYATPDVKGLIYYYLGCGCLMSDDIERARSIC
jgi:tetratricopeptide (TPR) repeat protein